MLKAVAGAPKGSEIARFLDWSLFETGRTDDWVSLKLVLMSPAQVGKANYWISWNGDRLARNKDEVSLAQHWPSLHAAVIEFLRGYP